MIVPDVPGVFVIVNYTENKFFFSYSNLSMYRTCSRHFYKIRRGKHENIALHNLHKSLILGHQIEYFHIITGDSIDEDVCSLRYSNIKNKLHQLIQGFETYDLKYGYNSGDMIVRESVYTDFGIYLITVRNKITNHKRFYIGKADLSNGINSRLQTHQYELLAGRHTNKQLQNEYNKVDNVTTFSPLLTFYPTEISSKQLSELEVHIMSIFRTIYTGRGFNKNAKGIIVHV